MVLRRLPQPFIGNGLHAWNECIKRCARCRRWISCAASRPRGGALSFTLAADELFVTQSALSRQIKALEDALGVALFERRHRALALTPPAARSIARDRQPRGARRRRRARARQPRAPGVTLSTTVSFASLWIIPRLARFARGTRTSRCTCRPTIASSTSRAAKSTSPSATCPSAAVPAGARAPVRRADDAGREPGVLRQRRTPLARRPISRTTCCCTSTIRKAACRGSTGAAGSRQRRSRA